MKDLNKVEKQEKILEKPLIQTFDEPKNSAAV